MTYRGDRATISSNTTTDISAVALAICSFIIMFNKICQVASLLSLLLSGSMAAFGYVAIRYMQSPEFERDLKNKLMGDLKEKMIEEIPLQMPKMTSPAIPF